MKRTETRRDMLRVLNERTPAPSELDDYRSRTRGDCVDGERPCPWFGCRFHLGLNVNESNGSLWHAFDDDEPGDAPTCALDVADADPTATRSLDEYVALEREGCVRSRDEVAALLGVHRDTVEDVEASALHKLRRALRVKLGDSLYEHESALTRNATTVVGDDAVIRIDSRRS